MIDYTQAGVGIASFLGGLATFWTVTAEGRRQRQKAADEEREQQRAEHAARLANLEAERKQIAAAPAHGAITPAQLAQEIDAAIERRREAEELPALRRQVEEMHKQKMDLSRQISDLQERERERALAAAAEPRKADEVDRTLNSVRALMEALRKEEQGAPPHE